MGKKIYTDEIVSNAVKSTVQGTELLTNGGFTTWSEGLPTGWSVTLNGGSFSDEGGGVAKLTNADAPADAAFLEQGETGLTENDVLDITVSCKGAGGEPPKTAIVIVYNNPVATATKYWDGSAWQDIGAVPELTQALSSDETGSFDDVTGTVTVPATGNVYIYCTALGPLSVVYFRTMSLATQESTSTEDFGTLKIREAVGDLVTGDKLMPIYDKNDVLIAYIDPATKAWVFPE